MRSTNQEQFRLRVKTYLVKHRLTISHLANRIGHPRPSVSKAINQGHFPRLRKKIEEAIG
jgi:hypothetical protein